MKYILKFVTGLLRVEQERLLCKLHILMKPVFIGRGINDWLVYKSLKSLVINFFTCSSLSAEVAVFLMFIQSVDVLLV